MTKAERQEFMGRMRVPAIAFGVLLALLAINVALGALAPLPHVWIVQLGIAIIMLIVVMLMSMEVLHEPPLMRLFAVLGFCWVAILFTMTLIDYLTR